MLFKAAIHAGCLLPQDRQHPVVNGWSVDKTPWPFSRAEGALVVAGTRWAEPWQPRPIVLYLRRSAEIAQGRTVAALFQSHANDDGVPVGLIDKPEAAGIAPQHPFPSPCVFVEAHIACSAVSNPCVSVVDAVFPLQFETVAGGTGAEKGAPAGDAFVVVEAVHPGLGGHGLCGTAHRDVVQPADEECPTHPQCNALHRVRDAVACDHHPLRHCTPRCLPR